MKPIAHAKTADLSAALEIHGQILQALALAEEPDGSLSDLLHQVEALATDHPHRSALLKAIHQALSIGKRLERHRQNELSLKAVAESAQSLTELKEVSQLLAEIVERGRQLLGSDLAWLAGVDSDGKLFVRAISGILSDDTRKLNPTSNVGVAGYVFRTRSPFYTHDYLGDTRFDHTPESDAIIEREALQSVVAVPLFAGSEVAGVLVVGDRYTRTYLPREISILGALAAHASVAVRNARAYDMTRQALLEAEEANHHLQKQTAALEFAADAHERLTKLLARGATLKDLIDSVASILDGRVMYLDAAGTEICVAASPNYHHAPAVKASSGSVSGIDASIQAAIGQSRVTGGAVPVESAVHSNTAPYCQVAAVMSGDELCGSLVIQTASPMTEQAIRVFERSATVTAVLQLSAEKKSASLDLDIKLIVRTLLEPGQHHDSDLARRIERHGIDASGPLMLAVIDVDKSKAGHAARKLAGRFRHGRQISTEIDGQVVMIANEAESPLLEDELRAFLFEEISLSGVATVSGPHSSLDALPRAYPQLEKAIGLLHALRRSNCVVHASSLRMYAVLFQYQNADELEATIASVVGRVLEYDAKRNTRLADTLLAYLDNMQNARSTAAALHIHANTLHNRLEMIRKLLGDWETDGRVVEIHLALRLRLLKNDRRPVSSSLKSFSPS